MINVCKITDAQGQTHYINPFKIREVLIAMGNVVIVWDNGDKKTIDTNEAQKVLKKILTYMAG